MSDGQRFRRKVAMELNESYVLFHEPSYNRLLEPTWSPGTSQRGRFGAPGANGSGSTLPYDLRPDPSAKRKDKSAARSSYFDTLLEKRKLAGEGWRDATVIPINTHVWWTSSDLLDSYRQLRNERLSELRGQIAGVLDECGPGSGLWGAGIDNLAGLIEEKCRESGRYPNEGPRAAAEDTLMGSYEAWRRLLTDDDPMPRAIAVKYSATDDPHHSLGADFMVLVVASHALHAAATLGGSEADNLAPVARFLRGLGRELAATFRVFWPGPPVGAKDHVELREGIELFCTRFRQPDGQIDWEQMVTALRRP